MDYKTFFNRKPKSKKPTPSELLIERIKKELGYGLSSNAKIVRTGASRDWRASGRWIWEIKDPNSRITIGSDSGVRELLKSKYLVVDHYYGGRVIGYDYLP